MWQERRASLLIGLELLVVTVFMWFAVDSLLIAYKNFSMPLGFDISHVYHVELGSIPQKSPDYIPLTEESSRTGADFLTIINRLRQHPDVEAASHTSWNHFHYKWQNSFTAFQLDSTIIPRGYVRSVAPSYFSLFKVKAADGRDAQLLIDALERNEIVVTQLVAETFFGSVANAIGKEISCKDQGNAEGKLYRIGAVCENQRYNEFSDYDYAYYKSIPASDMGRSNINALNYPLFIRVKATADNKRFPIEFQKEMAQQLKLGNIYLKEIHPMSEYREEHIRKWIDDMRMNMAVIVFFLLNVFLGVIGTFWLKTQQKQGEIGLRIAVGATRGSIFGWLISQAVIILLVAFTLASIIFGNLCYMGIVSPSEWMNVPERILIGIAVTFLLLLVMIVIGISFPAYRAMRLQPAEALHYE